MAQASTAPVPKQVASRRRKLRRRLRRRWSGQETLRNEPHGPRLESMVIADPGNVGQASDGVKVEPAAKTRALGRSDIEASGGERLAHGAEAKPREQHF